MSVYPLDESKEYFFKEGCYILEMMNSEADPAVSIARARVSPGVKTKLHRLKDTTERYVILSGQAEVQVGQEKTDVKAGDAVFIPVGESQSIANTGEQDLIFLAICAPRFQPECYEELIS